MIWGYIPTPYFWFNIQIVKNKHTLNFHMDPQDPLKTTWWFGRKFGTCLKQHVGVSKNRVVSLQIIHFDRVFHYFHHPFWGPTPIFGSTPTCAFFVLVSMSTCCRSQLALFAYQMPRNVAGTVEAPESAEWWVTGSRDSCLLPIPIHDGSMGGTVYLPTDLP